MAFADIAGIEVRHTSARSLSGPQVSEGPGRWERARLNAEAHPKSKAAKLYRTRRQCAIDVVTSIGEKGVFVFEHSTGYSNRRRYACSVECAAMQYQLRHRTSSAQLIAGTLHYALNTGRDVSLVGQDVGLLERSRTSEVVRRVDLSQTPLLKVTCRVCGAAITGDKVTVKGIEKKTADVTTYVLVHGAFVRVADLQVVDLTDHDRDLLSQYGTADTRESYVFDHGRRFDA